MRLSLLPVSDVVTMGMRYLPLDCAVIEFKYSHSSIDLNDFVCDGAN